MSWRVKHCTGGVSANTSLISYCAGLTGKTKTATNDLSAIRWLALLLSWWLSKLQLHHSLVPRPSWRLSLVVQNFLLVLQGLHAAGGELHPRISSAHTVLTQSPDLFTLQLQTGVKKMQGWGSVNLHFQSRDQLRWQTRLFLSALMCSLISNTTCIKNCVGISEVV